MQKKLSLILAMLMLASAMTACSDTGADNSDTAETTAAATPSAENEAAEETDPEDTRASIPDDLPERDFGGKDFIVLGSDDEHFGEYIVAEELNGEVVNDAVFQRNLTIEERFNAKVGRFAPSTSYGDTSNTIRNAVNAGDSETFHLISYHVVEAGGIAVQGNLLIWYDVPNINFDKPWWSDSTVESDHHGLSKLMLGISYQLRK